MNSNSSIDRVVHKRLSGTWVEYFRNKFISYPPDLPEIILVLSSICTIGAFLNLRLKDFLIPLPVILFLIGCSFEILSFTSDQAQRYADAIQWMDPNLFFNLFPPIIFFNAAFDMDVYMLQKLLCQILLITIPGFAINYTLIFWYLASVNKLYLNTISQFLFSTILLSSDPMLTAAAIRDLGLSKVLVDLINGESLITSIITFTLFASIMEINVNLKHMNHSLAHEIVNEIWSCYLASFLFGILSSKMIQLWMSTILGDDVNHISLSFSFLYLIFFICELVGMSGIVTLAIMGLFLNSTSFKPGVESLLLKFWNCLSFVAFLMVFTFVGLLIPAPMYLHISFSDIYYSLSVYFTLIALRLLVFLLMSPLLSRLGDGFSWRWAFIMVWSEMRGMPNINMALLFAYSDFSLASEKEKSQVLFHGVSVCLVTLMVSRVILPVAVSKLGLCDVTSTKYKSLYYTFQHFQEITKSVASALKFDKDLANADWNMVEKAIKLQNPYALNQGETPEHQKVTCPNCNKEVDGTLNMEALELANRRLLSAQIASYQRQYRSEILSQSAVQMLVGAAGSFGEKGEYMSLETIKAYSESKKFLSFIRKVLLNWVYNTKKEKGVPSRYYFLRLCHKIVFTEEFECIGYLMILMNIFPLIISWIPRLNNIYDNELRNSNHFFLLFYILEALIKIAAMRKEYFLHTWNLFELIITLIGIIDVILIKTHSTGHAFNLIQMVVFLKTVRLFRILRILKLITPKLLQLIDKKMSHQISLKYAILKGYVQGEADIMTIINQIANSKQVKQMLLKKVTRNTVHAMKELGYLECDHPDIAVNMKTKEEINVMLNLAKEIIKVFRLKGILHKIEASEINKLIMDKKRELLDFQPITKAPTTLATLYHIPWLDKNKKHINFIKERAKIITYDCGNNIFEEGDEPKGIYIIISGMVKTCFIPKSHLYEAFEQCCPHIEYKMWLKLGLSITAKKIREHLSYEDWTYKMQLKLCNINLKDIPKGTKTDIYDETVIYVILIHGAVEDCQLRKVYKAPFLIPITCHQIQGTEEITKVMIVQTPIDAKNFRWSTRTYILSRKPSIPKASSSPAGLNEEGLQNETVTEIQELTKLSDVEEEMNIYENA
ncbi:solute carrier family 9 member C1 [Pteropus medius]|uniref:sodium/hydrogen exchanger 10 n=1 Tax=Pteropus vampyrus TaxID=132908 RepID=UPI00196ABA90|nr:sodium/hydrogen exchanger 10 [Pteropus giganteus]